jgi:hypothetical protein
MWADSRNYARLWAATLSGLGKVKGSRMLVLSSAGSPGHPSFKRWTTAVESDHWRASLTVGPSPWWSAEDVKAAQADLTPAEFRRYVLCEWAEGEDTLATASDVAACVGAYRVREPVRGVTYRMSIDIGTRRDATVIAVGHLEGSPSGRKVVIDRTLRWTGTREQPVSLTDVEEALLACWRAYGRPKLTYDFHQAAQITERLKAAGVRAEEFVFSTAGVNRLARCLFGVLRDRAITLPNDPVLLDELGKVRLVETGPGLVRLDHRSGDHDDQAVACAMVAASLMDRPIGSSRMFVAQGEIPPMRLLRKESPPPGNEPPVPVVQPGKPRRPPPGQRLRIGRFEVDRRFYHPPGSR